MRTTIDHALDVLDVLDKDEQLSTRESANELNRIVRRVQNDYLEIIENALPLLIQNKEEECLSYLGDERTKLDGVKTRIGNMISEDNRWSDEFHRLAIKYLYTRARLVDELLLFPNFTLELLERLTLDQSLAETITYLENAMTGKNDLFNALVNASRDE